MSESQKARPVMKTDYRFKDLPVTAQKHVRIYQIQQFLTWSGFGITLVVLVLLLQERGFNLFDIALITATYYGTALIFELPFGGLADGIGRKPVYVLGVFADLTALLILLYFGSFNAAIVSYALYGFGRALSSGSLDAWYIEAFKRFAPHFSTVPILAKIQFSSFIGLAIGSVLGGFIADYFGPKMAQFGYGIYDAALFGNLFMALLMLSYTLIYIKEDRQDINMRAIKKGFADVPLILKQSINYAVGHQIISVLLMSIGLISLALFTLETFWVPYAKPMIESQYAVSIIGIINSMFFLALAIGSSLAPTFVNEFKGQNAMALAFLVMLSGVFLICLSLSDDIYLFAFCLFFHNLVWGAQGAPSESLFHDYIPNEIRSTLLSLRSLTGVIGGLIGMLGLGYVAEQYSISTAWQIGGFIVMLAGLMLLVLPKRMLNTSVVGLDEPEGEVLTDDEN